MSVLIVYMDVLGSFVFEVLIISNVVDFYVYSDYVEFLIVVGNFGYFILVIFVIVIVGFIVGVMIIVVNF